MKAFILLAFGLIGGLVAGLFLRPMFDSEPAKKRPVVASVS